MGRYVTSLGKEARDLASRLSAGFAKIDGQFQLVESKFSSQIQHVETKLSGHLKQLKSAGTIAVGLASSVGGYFCKCPMDSYAPGVVDASMEKLKAKKKG